MSAHPAHVLIGQGRLSEHASLLQKPFGSGALIRRVADLLADAKGSSSALLAPGYAPANRGASASPPQPRGTVLVLEDEPSARTAICEYLRDIGWTVIEAAGAEEAILGAQSQPIDVLLADYRLPGATGDVIARRVLDLHPDSSVVYMSGFPELDLDPPGPVLAKPLDLDEVGEAVQAARAVGEGPVLECPDPAAK
jgi:CheY-like chemotaxis protein